MTQRITKKNRSERYFYFFLIKNNFKKNHTLTVKLLHLYHFNQVKYI